MATGRTISASFLTDIDKQVITLCDSISKLIYNLIDDKDDKKDFKKQFGKISFTRDGGLGLGGGKLQRDAICTRGRQGKAPYSNRNLRWHPLVVAESPILFAKEIERIEIKGEDERQTLIFVVKEGKRDKKYPSDRVHELPERYVVLPQHWIEHIERLKHWSDLHWTQNSCVIPAYEACDWQDSVETYAVLAIALATVFYKIDFDIVFEQVFSHLRNQKIDRSLTLPTRLFPTNMNDIIHCPVCKLSLDDNLEEFRKEKRIVTWQPAWRKSKKSEGEDGSIQILHVNPLIETEIRHKANTVRYGHRRCVMAVTDHYNKFYDSYNKYS